MKEDTMAVCHYMSMLELSIHWLGSKGYPLENPNPKDMPGLSPRRNYCYITSTWEAENDLCLRFVAAQTPVITERFGDDFRPTSAMFLPQVRPREYGNGSPGRRRKYRNSGALDDDHLLSEHPG